MEIPILGKKESFRVEGLDITPLRFERFARSLGRRKKRRSVLTLIMPRARRACSGLW
jgi:hypothetical protein